MIDARRLWTAVLEQAASARAVISADLPHEPHVNSINNGQTQWSRVLKLKGISILLVLIVSVGAISPQLYASLIIPPRVRFTGVLLPNKDPSRKGCWTILKSLLEMKSRP